jgi:hypothetical protein
MVGFAGTYTHAAGDQFIFKGGVSWLNATFPLSITNSGSSDGTRDYYGIDVAWYTGGSWTRPTFDLQSTVVSGANNVVDIAAGVAYVTIDNIEVINFYWGAPDTWAYHVIFHFNTATYITFKNLYIHAWTHGTYASGARDGARVFLGYTGAPYNAGVIIEDCIVDGSPSGTDGMMGTFGGCSIVRRNIFRYMSNAVLVHGSSGNIKIYGNDIHHILDSFDSAQHGNGIETFGPAEIHQNKLHDLESATGVVMLTGPTLGGGGYDYIYNNLFYNNANLVPVQLDTDADPSSSGYYVYNNTIQTDGNTACIRVLDRGYGTVNVVDIRNNHMITEHATGLLIEPAVTNYTANSNLLQTNVIANGQGYVDGNEYAATLGGSTINAGVDLSGTLTLDSLGIIRPQGAAWDIGVYEYDSGVGAKLVMVFK